MNKIKLKLFSLLLIPLSWLLYLLFSKHPDIMETLYSKGLNKSFIQGLSRFTGFLPLSVGELLFYFALFFVSFCLIRFLAKLIKSETKWSTMVLSFLLNGLTLFSVVYFLFLSMWGFNYLRPRFKENLSHEANKHTTEELAELYAHLIEEANALSKQTIRNEEDYMLLGYSYQEAFERASLGYDEAAKLFPSLGGSYGRPKPILMSPLMSYTGISGIYSPFTGEANVNVSLVDHAIPAVAMHEMAHQRGYANEDEANFIAFLTSSMHPDVEFKYSGYLLALSYTRLALSRDNPVLLGELSQKLSREVTQDLEQKRLFWKQYEGAVEAFSSKLNDTYLKANGVTEGEKSYGKMVDLLLDYYQLHLKEKTSL